MALRLSSEVNWPETRIAIFSTSAFTVPLGWMAFCCCRVWISWETSSPMAASCCVENSR